MQITSVTKNCNKICRIFNWSQKMIQKGKERDEIKKTSHILCMKQKCIMRHAAKGGFFNDQLCGFFQLLKANTRQIQDRERLSQKPLPYNVDLRWI